jgi:hypothetical protein
MADFTGPEVERAESLLRPMMPGPFRVIYDPKMLGRDGRVYRWFQVVFAVGPGDARTLRSKVHALFPAMLVELSQLRLATDADVVSLRARRFCPDNKILDPEHPVMFIEAEWAGAALRAMQGRGDFSMSASDCLTYRNHFASDDPLTKQYGEPVK